MDLAGLSHEGGATSVAVRGPNGVRDRLVVRPRGAAVRTESLHVVAPASVSAPATEASVEALPAATPDTADRLQADYFVRLLVQNRLLIDHRIDEYRKAIATAEARGDIEGARVFRRMTLVEEQDRQTLEGMIDRLRGRFPRHAPGEGSPIARRGPRAVR